LNVLASSLVFVVAACLTIGAVHLVVAWRRPGSRLHLWFALAALLAACNAAVEVLTNRAETLEAFNLALKWAILFQGLCWIAFVWFLVHFAGTERRWLAWTVTAGFVLALIVHLGSPYGVLFSEIREVLRLELPWGESYLLPVGGASPWRAVSDLTILFLIVFAVDSGVRLFRGGERRRAWRFTAASAFILASLVHGSLVDFLVVRSPYLMSFGFLAAVFIMGLGLADDAVRASELSRRVVAQESRWRSLLEEVELLVAGVDRTGRIDYVNPRFCRLTGLEEADLLGRRFLSLLPAEEREETEANFRRALEGSMEPSVERGLLTRDGEKRRILWSNVLLRHSTGRATGILSVGADVTDQRRAESARDEALRSLEELKNRLEEENLYLREEIRVDRHFSNIVGESDALRYVLHRVQEVAGTDTTVLIEGETGVGKELVARAVHQASDRSDGPFVKIDCAALPATLIESELFGHEAGAFTGATRRRKGRFELARGGTILLDEIGELPLDLQGKLLRVLQDGEFERVGGSGVLKSEARVIAATNRDLAAEVSGGRFREDLFYRLNVYPITVPPLRDRREDIPLLVRHFLPTLATRAGRSVREIPLAVLRRLEEHPWPGNVRELQNVLERAVLASPGKVLRLPGSLGVVPPPNGGAPGDPTTETLEDVERRHVLGVLKRTGGRVAGPGGAAEILGMHPNTLRHRIKKLGIRIGRASKTVEGPEVS
jgi:PAS domain S-box-containing protein